jgi:hypothetical protein
MSIEAMKKALTALEFAYGGEPVVALEKDAIKALRQALDQLPDTTEMIERTSMSASELADRISRGEKWKIAETSMGLIPSEWAGLEESPNSATDVVEPIGEVQIEQMERPFNAGKVVLHFYGEPPPVGTKLYAAPPSQKSLTEALFQAQNAAIDLARQVEKLEAQLAVKPEPFGWLFKQADGNLYKLLRGEEVEWSENHNPHWIKVSPLYTAPPKPDLLTQTCCECGRSGGYALYCGECWEKATKREWVELTDEEVGWLTVFDGLTHIEVPILAEFVRTIEAKLKEKNHVS